MARQLKKQALGRGLSALLKDSSYETNTDRNEDVKASVVGKVVDINVEEIDTNPNQPRTGFFEENLKELAKSIEELGVIQPLTVRNLNSGFQLISGERRLRACKMLNMKTVPAYVRVADDIESLEMALVENIQRQDLDPIEIALSYRRLIEEIQLTQEQLSTRVGKKRSTVTNYLRLLSLDPIIQSGMRDGFLSMGHGRALIGLNDKQRQLDVYRKIISRNISVRETEQLVKFYNDKSQDKVVKQKKKQEMPGYIDDAKQVLKEKFPGKIDVKMTNPDEGHLIIKFNSKGTLDDFVNKLTK